MIRQFVVGSAVAVALSLPAFAHHGWNWAEDEQTELSGVITQIEISPPHPLLMVDVDGEIWTVELGNPALTERSGFVEGSASPGDAVVALGHRSLDHDQTLFKAVRLTIGEEVFDIYPDLIEH